MASPITVIVAYPSKHPETNEPIRFDMSYYTSTHIPLVEKHWAPHGLISYSVHQFQNPDPLTGEAPAYFMQSVCTFRSLEGLQSALEKEGPVTKPDVHNFSNIFPTLWVADPIAERSVAGS